MHGRDHALSHCHAYCPWRFWKTVRDTFEDPEVYQTCMLERTALLQFLNSLTRQSWLRPYQWGIRRDAPLPTAYILIKQKKQFKAARPIIDYKRFVFAKLFRATAIVLDLLQKECLPQSYGNQTFPQMVQSLIQFLEQYPVGQPLRTYNQDLVGFFTSIPVDRILRSVEWLIEAFTAKN